MTVQELIDHLRQLPPDHPVLVEGYENGWDSLLRLELGHVTQQIPVEDWDGEFERLSAERQDSSQVVLLVGRRGHRRAAKTS